MRTIRWSLATLALVMAGSLVTGCKSSSGGSTTVDGGTPDGGTDSGTDGGHVGTPGFQVNPTANLQTTEMGGQTTFKVSLTAQPSADVTITLESSDESEGKVTPVTLVFTPANWNAEQVVTETGQDDSDADGNVTYQVVFNPATSSDARYVGLHPASVQIVNVDNDTPGFMVTGDSSQHTSESGTSATYSVALTTKPTANVTVALTSSDTGEVTVLPAAVTFTPDDWNAAHVVTLRGVDDTEVDGPQTVTIATAPAVSADAAYNGKDAPDLTVINDDDDSVSFIVKPSSGLVTSESGAQASFTVRLNSPPAQNVTVDVTSSNTAEATVYPSKLTFTPANWKSSHAVIVAGVDDAARDGNQPYTIMLAPAVSADARFNGVDPADVTGTNTDNDSPGVTVTASPDLEIFENGGQGTFTVVLNKAPSASVTIPVSSSNTAKATAGPNNLVFTAENWNAPQTVTVTAIDNLLKDGRQAVNIVLGAATSSDAGYNGIDPIDVGVYIIDDDGPGLRVATAPDLTTDETGRQTTFTVRLNSKPAANVTVPVVSGDTGEIIVSPAMLTFTPDNYASPHTVTLTGVNDDLLDGPQPVDLTVGPSTSSDADYLNLPAVTVTATNVDDDTAGVTVTPSIGLLTGESGAQDHFTVVLNHAPTAAVSFMLSSSNTAEATVLPTSLIFTTANWNAPQTVTLTGVDDMTPIADGRQPYSVIFTPAVSDDPEYSGMQVLNVLGSNADNDTPGVTVTAVTNNFTTSEGGTQATFNVVLDTQPTDNVVISVVSSATGEGTVDVSSLTFTPSDWAGTHRVIVTGVNDNVADGPQTYPIVLGPATSADTNYSGLVIANVNITNTDNDTAGVTVDTGHTPVIPLVTSEAGGQATFTVSLHSEPTGVVTIPLATSKPGEARISPTSLTFTPGSNGDWNSTKTVTVTGLGDLAPDGDQAYTIVFGAIQSTDATYAAITIANLDATNIDNDSAHISVVGNNLVTDEGGGEATFTISLGAPPASNVTIPITVSDPGEAEISSGSLVTTVNLVFTPADYASPRDITLHGIDDLVADGPQPYHVTIGPAVSTDPNYGGRIAPSVSAVNNDNDTAGITIVAAEPLATDEFGNLVPTFTVVLNSQPTDDVTIPLVSSDTTEGSVSPMALTFIAATGVANSWDNPHTVAVTGLDDFIADGSQPYFIQVGPASSSDAKYNNMTVPNVAAYNTDNDSPGLTIVAPNPLATSEAGGNDTFTVRLTSQPIADVTVNIGSTRPTEGVPVNAMLTFTAAAHGGTNSWEDPQTVTIRGVDDFVADRSQNYQITVSSTSTDPNYVISNISNLDAQNADNDTAGYVVSTTGPLSVNEPSQATTFTVRLVTQPTATVTVPLTLDLAGELAVSPASLTFTPDPTGSANSWADPQTVTLTAIDDNVADGLQTRNVSFGPIASTDADYTNVGILPGPITVDVFDDDSAGVTLSKTSVRTFEVGTPDTFTVVLTSQPSVTATISLVSDDTTEATVSPSSLVFMAENWNIPQTVTVTGVQDVPVVLDGDQAYNINLSAPAGPPEYVGLSRSVSGINYQAFLHCREVQTIHPMAPSGVYVLDADRAGPVQEDAAYCDMTTEGGGWTLLSWTADSDMFRGAPYPGLAYCGAFSCTRGSGVRSAAAADALFANATELAQGQGITTGAHKATFADLGTYEFAGTFVYPSLASLTTATGSAACVGLTTGTYHTLADSSDMTRNDGTVVYLDQSMRLSDTLGDYSSDSNSYAWSIGNRTGSCATNGTPPASVVGTWQAAQYGPAFQNAAGSYSVWLR